MGQLNWTLGITRSLLVDQKERDISGKGSSKLQVMKGLGISKEQM